MKKTATYLKVILSVLMLLGISPALAEDDGTDDNGRFLLSEVLALRCGLSSTSPVITEDCIKRLAYDYKTDTPVGYSSYKDERSAIIGDYAKAYLYEAVTGMIAGGDYEDRIDELIGKDPSLNVSLDGDAREDIEFNNKLSADNAVIFLDALHYRASAININNITNILNRLVPSMEIDTEDTSLAKAP